MKTQVLKPKEVKEIVIQGEPQIKDSEIKSGNTLEGFYTSSMNQRSSISPSIEALTDTMTGIDKEEDSSQPGKWNCEVEFENESDFDITVKQLTLSKQDKLGEDEFVNIEPQALVKPEQYWTHAFSVTSPSVPTIHTNLDFTANYAVPTRIISKITKQPTTFKVLETSAGKKIEPGTMKAN